MTRLLNMTPIVLIAMLASASPAVAQTGTVLGRGFIVVNGGYQVTGNDFEKTSTLRANAEDGSFTSEYEVKGGPTFDVGGGVTLSRRFAIGAGLTRFSRSTTSSLNGSVPHPFYFNHPRTVTGDVIGLSRAELAVYVQAQVIAPVGPRLQFTVFGGPSFFKVDQELVTDFTWVDSYPFDEASFGTASRSARTDRPAGSMPGWTLPTSSPSASASAACSSSRVPALKSRVPPSART